MSPKTAYLKQTSEQRCREAFDAYQAQIKDWQGPHTEAWLAWVACWKYLEERLLKEIQS